MKLVNRFEFLFVIALLSFIISVFYLRNSEDCLLYTQINVGQGDSALIQYKDVNLLIDTGANDQIIPKISHYTDKLDTVFITHADLDHYGALPLVVKEYNPEYIYTNTKDVAEISKSIGKSNVYAFNYLDVFKFNDIKLQNYNKAISSDSNGNSLVLLITGPLTHNIITTGDAPETYINKAFLTEALSKPSIFKVSHHGSHNNTSAKSIPIIRNSINILSYGPNNYGHPAKEVVKILEENSKSIYRTETGDIQLKICKYNNLTVEQ